MGPFLGDSLRITHSLMPRFCPNRPFLCERGLARVVVGRQCKTCVLSYKERQRACCVLNIWWYVFLDCTHALALIFQTLVMRDATRRDCNSYDKCIMALMLGPSIY